MPVLRSTGKIILFILLLMLTAFVFSEEPGELNEEVNIEELRKRILGEPPKEIMDFSLGDSGVSLFMTGSWMGALQGNAGFSTSALGTKFASPQTPLLFTQEADLTMSLWMNKRWFVEASFLDDSEKNTYRAGYQGLPGEFIKYAGVGNTGLDFPSFPYLDLGGDSPSSFGFYGRMGSGGIDVHTLFRYDAASRDEKVFLGGRERTFNYIELSNSVRGVSFVLPDWDIDSEIIVYIEDEKGSLRDSDGRRWRLAAASEYAAGKTQGLLELNIRPEGMVAVSYSKGVSRPWNVSMGSYSGGSGFLFEVQKWFGSGISLSNYPSPREISIGGIFALVIREPGIFSPFERRNRYEPPSSLSEEAALVRLSSGAAVSGYRLVPLDISAASADIPLYVAAVSKRNIYELLPETSGLNQRSPETRWPLAKEYPEVYLPGSRVFSGDACLKFTNYGGAGSFQIGADVVPGSIQVWRGGIMDANFSYNQSTGEVALKGPAGANELIRITFLKRSAETRLGSIASGIGAVYQKEGSPFSAQAAVGVRWNMTDSSFSEEGTSSPGTVGLSAKTAWDFDNLKAQVTAGAALDQNDTTGLYRAAGMEGYETLLSLPPETSFLSNPPSGFSAFNRADLLYRNYYNNTVIGSALMPIDWNGAVIVPSLNKPYPVKDPQIKDAQSLAMEFTLNGTEKWTGFQVPLDYEAEIISRAGEIEIPYRLYGFKQNILSDFKLIVQIGSLSGKDFAYNENTALVWEKQLFSSGGTAFDNSLRIARFVITETERVLLADAKYLRVIAALDGVGEEVTGVVILSPPIVRGAPFRPVIFDGSTVSGTGGFSSVRNRVTVLETADGGNLLEAAYGDIIKRLHTTDGTQRILRIAWESMEPGISAGIDGRMGELPLADYRALSFFVKGPANKNGTLNFFTAEGPNSIFQPKFEAHIPLGAFREGQWSKVTIRYNGTNTGISVDGVGVPDAWFRYLPAPKLRDKVEGKSGYTAVLITPGQGSALNDDNICIDEIILEDAAMAYRLNAGGAFEYKKSGTLISINDTDVLSDFLFTATVESEFRADPINRGPETAESMAQRTGAEISFLGAKIYGNLLYSLTKDDFLWSADHGISREWELFSFKETFYASPNTNSAKHGFNAGFSSNFYTKIDAGINYDYSGLERKWALGMGYKSERDFIPSVDITGAAAWSQDDKAEENENYAGLWIRTWGSMIPDAGKNAKGRKTSAKIIITESTKPVGAVVTLEGKTSSTGLTAVTNLENSAFLDVPVILNKTSLNFRAGRLFKKQINFFGSDVKQESEKFFESINDFLPLWKTIPGYSLFAYDINEAMDKSRNNSPSFGITQYMAFNDHFGVKANFPSMFNLAAFVVPSGASLRLERIIEQKLDTRSDMLNFSGSLGFSAVNMFGTFGYLPLFKFYKSDEFTHAAQAAVIFPRNEDVSWKVQSAIGMSFRGFEDAVLNLANTLTLRSKGLWLESAVVDWTIPVKKSLLGVFYDWIAEKAAKQKSWLNLSALLSSNYEHFRKESLELAVEQTDDNFRVMCSAGHEAVIRIQGRLNFSGFVKLRFNRETKTETLTVDGLLGTGLKVSF